MIVLKENERLYLNNWNYNAARIITELAKIVNNKGGRVKPTKCAIISNRSINAAKLEYQEKISKLENRQQNEKTTEFIKILNNKLSELEKVKNDPITVTHTSYITFIYDDCIYYYQVDDNPLFPFYYSKTNIINDKYSKDAALTEDKKEWLFDCFFSWGAVDADIKEASNFIFNMLVTAKNTPIIRDSKKQRVQNTFNNSYHYETIYTPER